MFALRRVIKKTFYILILIVILALLVVFALLPGLNLFRRPPEPPTVSHESIIIESVDTIVHNDTVDIIARIRNPNPRAGIPDYTLTFILLDGDGNKLQTITRHTYLLPGKLKYIAALDIPYDSSLSKVRVEKPSDPTFVASSSAIAAPSFNSFLRDRTSRTIGGQIFTVQKGIVTNTSTLGFRRVDITGIAFDSSDKVIGIGQTFIGEFKAGQQREFTLQWPKPLADIAKVIILPDTNVYHQDNILTVIGDPARLREQPVTDNKNP